MFVELYLYFFLYTFNFVLGFFYLGKFNDLKGKLFLTFLGVSAIVEGLGAYNVKNEDFKNVLYFCYTYFFFYIWFAIFYKLLKLKVKVFIVITIFTTFSVLNLISLDFLSLNEIKWVFVLGVVLLLVLSINYFQELLNSEKILVTYRILYFWTTFGLVLFCILYIPILFMNEAELFKKFDLFYTRLIQVINIVLNICFSIGIIWSQKKHNMS